MIKVEFNYDSVITLIQAMSEDKMGEICFKYFQKTQIDMNNIIYIYSGKIVNPNLSISQIINKVDKERNKMNILVVEIESQDQNLIKSPHIICPICKESARYEVKDYKFRIYNCKNEHITDNILLNDFENTQLIDESLIICGQCKINNKSNAYNKEMYICNKCNMNLCPLCKSKHDKNHNIINYEQRHFICSEHNKQYNSYCEKCKKDICILCEKNHKEHKIISYDEFTKENINHSNLKENLNSFRFSFKNFTIKIKMIINRLNNVMKNIEKYYKLIEKNLESYNKNNINYNILQNCNYNSKSIDVDLGSNDILEEIFKFTDDDTYKTFIPLIFKMFNNTNKNEIDLIYNIPNNEDKIKIFGNKFVKQNQNLCKIIYNNKEYDLTEHFDCKNIKDNILKFKLKGINNVIDLESMFEGCSTLSHLSDFSNFDTSYVITMGNLFKDCKCPMLPDISKFNTSNVFNMNSMFEGCSSLKSLPDISKFNTSNVIYMSSMFSGCSSLKSLPDISNWKTSNVQDMLTMFEGCSSLNSLPDISNWNTCNVQYMAKMFKGCSSLNSLPDISCWNTSNAQYIAKIFEGCSSLKTLPDLSKWNINSLKDKGAYGMFEGCDKSLNIPEKFKK